jgi:hypothetical protein
MARAMVVGVLATNKLGADGASVARATTGRGALYESAKILPWGGTVLEGYEALGACGAW